MGTTNTHDALSHFLVHACVHRAVPTLACQHTHQIYPPRICCFASARPPYVSSFLAAFALFNGGTQERKILQSRRTTGVLFKPIRGGRDSPQNDDWAQSWKSRH